jgi:cytochrome bd-type quinol oxidase subunit 2
MDIATSRDRKGTARLSRAAATIVIAVAGPVLVMLLAGYITMQLQLVEAHAVLGFNDRLVSVEGDWPRYVWPVALILLVVAAVLVYRVAVRGTAARFTALAVLALLVLLAIPMASGPRINPEGYPLMTHIAVEGAKSPLVFALIGALVADFIAARSRVRP